MTSDPTRDPRKVVKVAQELWSPWAIWHPGDDTQYRIKIVPIDRGPDDGDQVLLVSCVGKIIAVQYAEAKYRQKKWTAARWKKEGSNDSPYDWWPKVIKPLLEEVGAA